VPQGVGAALAMPLAGWLTDRIGARTVVAVGSIVAALGMLAFTQVGADTSYLYLGGALLVLGLGIGSTVAPSMAAVFQTLARDEVPRATGALNAIQRIAGAIGTAVLAIVLQRSIAAKAPGVEGGLQGVAAAAVHPHATARVADAFATSFSVATGLIVASVVPALLLPKHRERPASQSMTRELPA
jgi:MFS family permease